MAEVRYNTLRKQLFQVIGICIIGFHFRGTSSENILVYGVLGSYSQRISIWPLVEALSDSGHAVTFLSSYESKDPHPKVHDYAPKKWKETMGPWEEHLSFYDIRKNNGLATMFFGITDLGVVACKALYSDLEFVNWLKSSKFDLIIVDSLMNECAYGMAHFHKAKVIVYGTQSLFPWYYDSFGLPDESSSVPELIFSFPAGKDINFFHRFVQAVNPLVWITFRNYWYFPVLEEISRKGLDLPEIPSFLEIERNVSLVLITTHYSTDYPRSLPPNVIPVGGAVVSGKPKPVSKVINNFIDQGHNGFIYVSFGTVAEFVNFDEQVRKNFIRAIGKFPSIKFVWKSSFPINETLPANVHVTTWAPQQSLLAHPKIKAFITHSGMGSSAEAIHFGVPVISFPVLADQDMNAAVVASRGAGIKLEITTLKESELENAILEILNNPKYRDGMKRMSEVFKDRQQTAVQNAVWWIEFILRNDDSNEFLRPLNVGQPWWIRRQIDVWLVFVLLATILIITPLYIIYKLCRKLVSLILPKTKTDKQKVQ